MNNHGQNKIEFLPVSVCLSFFATLFWLNLLIGFGNSSFVATKAGKYLLLIFTFISSSLCLNKSLALIAKPEIPGWLHPYIAAALSGVTMLILMVATLLFGFLYW